MARTNKPVFLDNVNLLFSRLTNTLISSILLISLPLYANENDSKIGTQELDCKLTLGAGEWPPYQHFTEDGTAQGLQIVLLKRIAAEANCQLIINEVRYTPSLKYVAEGKIDLTLNATYTQEREKFGWFSKPYRNESLALYVTPKFASDCKSMTIPQLIEKGFRLGLQNGMIYGKEIREIQGNTELNQKIKYFDHTGQDHKFADEHGLDGIIDDPIMIGYMSRKNKEYTGLSLCKVSISSAPVSLLFSKKTVKPEIVERFNQAIETIKATDYYQEHWRW